MKCPHCHMDIETVKVNHKAFLEYWNSKDRLPKMRVMSQKRKNCLRTRMQEPCFKGCWELAIDKMDASDFCTDKTSAWATADWFLCNDNNYIKVLEGKYDNKKEKPVIDNDEFARSMGL